MGTQCVYCDVKTEYLYVIYRNLKSVFRLPVLQHRYAFPPVDRRAGRIF